MTDIHVKPKQIRSHPILSSIWYILFALGTFAAFFTSVLGTSMDQL